MRILTSRRALQLLLVLSILSFGARALLLGAPCRAPCRSASDHVLVFDEIYYVNAARRIAGVRVPAGAPYASAPRGTDPNAEHPQLAKLIMAASIEVLGDGPWAWRLGSLVMGSLAVLGMFALVRAAGGGPWPALGAATLMALDNLVLVHSRIATLDVYVLAAMIWALVAYLRGRPLLAGGLIGVGACMKLVAPYALLVIAALEGLRLLSARSTTGSRRALARLGECTAAGAVTLVALLSLLDALVPPYDQTAGRRITGGVFAHLHHMVSFAAGQVSHRGPKGIASYPWQWLWDAKTIVYLNIEPKHPSRAFAHVHPAAHFLGLISPPILLLAVPGLVVAALALRRRSAQEIDLLALAWCAGTFLPFVALSVLWQRTSYIYYMVIVMPGIYLAVTRLVESQWRHPRLVWLWAAAVVA
ncbi:MAG: phospholipid carrier-dependent glycosyltransferase, partial [Solirubrobacteraceae bacterium]